LDIMTIRATRLLSTIGLLLFTMFLSGCGGFTLDTVPTIAALPTLAPSPVSTATSAVGEGAETPFALTQELSSTPAVLSTAPLGPTSAAGGGLSTLSPGVEGSQSPVIEYFMASPEPAAPGEPVVLIWSTLYGTNAAI
jgi:hypothetical protein